jgi:hypothetical protein
LGPQQESTQHGLSQQTPLQQLSKPGQQESPQHGWSQHSSPQQNWSAGQQATPPQARFSVPVQHAAPAQPLAGGSQTVAPHWVTRSAQTPSKQLPEQQSLSALQARKSISLHCPSQQSRAVESHPTHASPPMPQLLALGGCWQDPVSSQQPVEQVAASQAQKWSTQGVPAGHTAHWRPAEPQVWGVLPGWQVPVVGSQQLSPPHCTHAPPPPTQKGGEYGTQKPGFPGPFSQQPLHAPAAQTHWPLALSQTWPKSVGPQVPQLPPQPSGPQCLPVQSGVHAAHCWFRQTSPAPQDAQLAPPSPQASFEVPGRQVPGSPGPLEQQPFGQLCRVQRHWPVSSSQLWPLGHVPQPSALPQPSGPHARPAQLGVQQSPSGLHAVALPWQQSPSQQCPDALAPHSSLGLAPSAMTV